MNYPVKFKMHELYNFVEQARYQNPTFVWNYEFEDFMNNVIIMAKSAMPGSPMCIIGNKVLTNFYLVLELRLRDGFAYKL